MLSTYSETSFHLLGFLLTLVSNLLFALRGLFTNQLASRIKGDAASPPMLSTEQLLQLYFYVSLTGVALLLPFVLLAELPVLAARETTESDGAALFGGLPTGALFLLNACCHSAYNQSSFLLLSLLPLLSHAMLNLCRRGVMVAGATVLLGTAATGWNVAGVFLTLFGSFLYFQLKQRPVRKEKGEEEDMLSGEGEV